MHVRREKKNPVCAIFVLLILCECKKKKALRTTRILLVAGDLTFLSADSIWANYEIPWCTLPSNCALKRSVAPFQL